MLYPVVDIGANTVKMAMYDSQSDECFSPVMFKSHPLHLIDKREHGCMTQEGIAFLSNILTEFSTLCQQKGGWERMRLFATAPLRGIRNAKSVVGQMKEQLGKEIRILSPQEEAHYSFCGICATENVKDGLMMDMGGGSTEFLAFRGGKEENMHSFRFGCVSLTEKLYRYGVSNLQTYTNRKLKTVTFVKSNTLPLFLTGGSARAALTAKKILYGGGDEITVEQLYTLINDLGRAEESVKERLESLIRERAEQLPAVVFSLYCILCVTNSPVAKLARGGVREGFVMEWMKEEGVLP